jgi:hypothetical protein
LGAIVEQPSQRSVVDLLGHQRARASAERIQLAGGVAE